MLTTADGPLFGVSAFVSGSAVLRISQFQQLREQAPTQAFARMLAYTKVAPHASYCYEKADQENQCRLLKHRPSCMVGGDITSASMLRAILEEALPPSFQRHF